MKPLPAALAALLLATASASAKPPPDPAPDIPLFQGMADDDKQPQFGLASPDKSRAKWLRVGQSFEGWKLTAYDRQNDCLVVTKDGRVEKIPIASGNSGIVSTKATRADAEAALKAMKFGKLTAAVLAQQKKLVAQMVRDELARAGLANPTKEQLAAAEKIAMDQVRSEFAPDKMRAAFAGVFADLYTKEELQAQTGFMRSAGGKEALKAIGGQPSPDAAAAVEAFHQSVLGKSIRAKQRILNQKTAEILAPKTAAVQTKARKALQDYAATQK